MQSLVKEIGLAPSEMPPEEFLQRLGVERHRVQDGLMEFIVNNTKIPKKGTKKSTTTKKKKKTLKSFKEDYDELSKALGELGLTPEELLREEKK